MVWHHNCGWLARAELILGISLALAEFRRSMVWWTGLSPADTDLADPAMTAELEDAFGGGGYTALQRAALLQLAFGDQVSSGLDGREPAFELNASGGLVAWRARLGPGSRVTMSWPTVSNNFWAWTCLPWT